MIFIDASALIAMMTGEAEADALADVMEADRIRSIDIVAIGEREYELAAEAYAEFGKGRHPAALNMGDCFAYASAKAKNAGLLFKGEDFSKTDIRIATIKGG